MCVHPERPIIDDRPRHPRFRGIDVRTHSSCAWTARPPPAWITVIGAASGQGNGTVTIIFAANRTGQPRTGLVTIGNASGSATFPFAQAGAALGSLTGTVMNTLNNQPVADTSVRIDGGGSDVRTDSSGRYFTSLPAGELRRRNREEWLVPFSCPPSHDYCRADNHLRPRRDAGSGLLLNHVESEPGVRESQRSRLRRRRPILLEFDGQDPRGLHSMRDNPDGSREHVAGALLQPDGTLDSAATQTRTGAEFAEQFGVNPIPGCGESIPPPAGDSFHTRAAAPIDYVISGVDAIWPALFVHVAAAGAESLRLHRHADKCPQRTRRGDVRATRARRTRRSNTIRRR